MIWVKMKKSPISTKDKEHCDTKFVIFLFNLFVLRLKQNKTKRKTLIKKKQKQIGNLSNPG